MSCDHVRLGPGIEREREMKRNATEQIDKLMQELKSRENRAVDKVEGFLEVGLSEDQREVVVNHPDLKPDENGVGHIVFSPNQARNIAHTILRKATEAEAAMFLEQEKARIKSVPPVDRSARVLTDGSPVTEDHRELRSDGQQKGYVVLTAEERAKGFVRPVRRTYIHVGKPPEGQSFEYPITKTFPGGCGTRTTMGVPIAETYARDPGFYSGTFCCGCGAHFDLDQFVWEGTTEQVGS